MEQWIKRGKCRFSFGKTYTKFYHSDERIRRDREQMEGIHFKEEIVKEFGSLNPGDHIAVRRRHFGVKYFHHGIYIEGFLAIHCQNKEIKKVDLNQFKGSSELYRIEYTKGALPPSEVVEKANQFQRSPKSFRQFDLVDNNCEHFAVLCKTGKHFSKQAYEKFVKCLHNFPKAAATSTSFVSGAWSIDSYTSRRTEKTSTDMEKAGRDLCKTAEEALRMYFDSKFSPSYLQKHLAQEIKSHHHNFNSEEVKKLFRDNAVAPSTDFDISLLYKIIRLFESQNGWGKEPKLDETSTIDDIERIRHFRNLISHSSSSPSHKKQIRASMLMDLAEAIERLSNDILKEDAALILRSCGIEKP